MLVWEIGSHRITFILIDIDEEDLLKLEYVYYDKQMGKKITRTIDKIIADAENEIKTEYHNLLLSDQQEEGVPQYWVVVRVGLRRIVWRKTVI